MRKRRVTVTIDEDLLDQAAAAVTSGQSESLSAWVNRAMTDRAARERQLAALAELVGGYEAEHGEITDDELAKQAQADRDAAGAVRSRRRRSG